MTTTTQMMANMAGWSPDGEGNGGIYVGHGKVVATRTPEIAIPLPIIDPLPDDEGGNRGTTFANFIQVDSILTGGYAAAAVKAAHPAIDEGGGANTTAGPPPPPPLRGTTTETATTAP